MNLITNWIAGQTVTSAFLNTLGTTVNSLLAGSANPAYTTPASTPTNMSTLFNSWLGTASAPLAMPTTPIGNAVATNSVMYVNSTTAAATTREFALQVGMVATTGSTQTNNGSGDKTAFYAGMVGQSGGGNIWAINPLTTIASGWTGETGGAVQTAQVAEFDLNNNNVDYGNSTGTVYGNPAATGIIITGAGTHFCTSAIQVTGNISGGPMWRFGMWFGNLSIQNATIADTTNSVTSFVVNGSHTYGIDFNTGSFSGAPIRLANAQALVARNSGGTADLVLTQTAGNNMVLGGTGVGGIFCSANVVPSTTNTTALGQASNVWSTLWTEAVNITVNASLILTNQTNAAGSSAGTLTNAPAAGNPTFWLPVSVNGSGVFIPCWA